MYTAPLPMEMSLTLQKCVEVKTVEKYVEYIEEEVKRLYETIPRQPMANLLMC